jgi:hypothetical protein
VQHGSSQLKFWRALKKGETETVLEKCMLRASRGMREMEFGACYMYSDRCSK